VFARLLVLTLFFTNLYSCDGNFELCLQKLEDAHAFETSSFSIPIDKTRRLVYAQSRPNAKVLKYDPFLSLYIIKQTEPFAYPFEINTYLHKQTAVLHKKCATKGCIASPQSGLNTFARYSKKVSAPALLSDSCCFIEGIVTKRGIIQKAYIQHFLQMKNPLYGDIGIRLEDIIDGVSVVAVDPFLQGNLFKKGDRLLFLDGKKVRSAATCMQKVLFSKIGSRHTITLKRASKVLNFTCTTQKRYGGGFVSDTFLERKGLYFDRELHLVKIEKAFKNYGLHIGDKLIQVNGVKVSSQKELREYISKKKSYASLLFERNNFEFFVNIK
jgi:hypothetical protein